LVGLFEALPGPESGGFHGVVIGRKPKVLIVENVQGLRLGFGMLDGGRRAVKLVLLSGQLFEQRRQLEEDIAITLNRFEHLNCSGVDKTLGRSQTWRVSKVEVEVEGEERVVRVVRVVARVGRLVEPGRRPPKVGDGKKVRGVLLICHIHRMARAKTVQAHGRVCRFVAVRCCEALGPN
jgi:hypothetical protein